MLDMYCFVVWVYSKIQTWNIYYYTYIKYLLENNKICNNVKVDIWINNKTHGLLDLYIVVCNQCTTKPVSIKIIIRLIFFYFDYQNGIYILTLRIVFKGWISDIQKQCWHYFQNSWHWMIQEFIERGPVEWNLKSTKGVQIHLLQSPKIHA